MAYSITTTAGAPVATVQDGTINSTATSLTLIGRDYAGYGIFLNENFVHLLENFASNTAPSSTLTGQIWYDTSVNTLKVWNSNLDQWKPISSSLAQDIEPASGSQGDLWFDTTNNQLHAYNGGWQLIGPPSTDSSGTVSGAVVETILDSSDNSHVVIKLYISDVVMGIISYDTAFTPKVSINGFTTVNPGLTLVGSSAVSGVQFTGDATNALALNGVESSAFLRADQNTTTPYQLTVGNLSIGSGLVLSQFSANNEVALNSVLNNYNLNFYSNIGGITTRTVGINGATGAVTISNALSVSQTLSVAGAFTASSTTTLAGITTLQSKIIPNADGTIDIGASATKFANVFAGTFYGNISAASASVGALTVGNVSISTTSVIVGGNAMATQSYVTSYVQTSGRNSQGNKTISTSAPSGGSDGDIWYQV